MNNQPLTIRQAAILTEHSQTEVRTAIRDQRWPSFVDEHGRTRVSPTVLAQHWAMDLTDPVRAAEIRDHLTDLAEAADYPLDLDAVEHEARRHVRIEHELELESEGQRGGST